MFHFANRKEKRYQMEVFVFDSHSVSIKNLFSIQNELEIGMKIYHFLFHFTALRFRFNLIYAVFMNEKRKRRKKVVKTFGSFQYF